MKMKKGNAGVVVLIIALFVVIIAMAGYLLYSHMNTNNNENMQENTNVNPNNNFQKNENKNEGYMMRIDNGYIIVDGSGEVYLKYERALYTSSPFSTERELNLLSTTDLKYGSYTATPYDYPQDEKDIFEGYKLNVSNVISAYRVEFGNGGNNECVFLVHKDGRISQLIFEINNDTNKVDVELIKNVAGYSNIVSVVPNNTFDGQSAVLIDKAGNQIKYFGDI